MMSRRLTRVAMLPLVIFAVSLVGQSVQAQYPAAVSSAQRPSVIQPLCVMNVDGTGFRELAAIQNHGMSGSPDWSANGKFIAFDAHGPGFSDQHVYVVELESGEITDLGRGGVPSVSPDSERIAYHGGGGIQVVNRDGSGAKLLFEGGSHPRWSKDGEQIAYRTYDGRNLGIYDVETGQRRMLFDEPSSTLSWGRDWSPDGKQLAIRRGGRGASGELVLVNSRGSSSGLRVRYRGDMSSHVNWSLDGSRLLVGIYLPGDGPRHLHYLSPKGRGKPTPIPGQDPQYDYCDGTFSPDGKQIAFGWKRRDIEKTPTKP